MDDGDLVLSGIKLLKGELLRNVSAMGRDEARALVDAYYQIQDYRLAASNQERQAADGDVPLTVLDWLAEQMISLERQIKKAMDVWTDGDVVASWAKSQRGIGPVLSGALSAYIDIEKTPGVSHLWRFAGVDPTMVWEKGQKRPYSAGLKVIQWKIGESFVKISGRDDGFYGQIYLARKAYEQAKNMSGAYAEQAAHKLATQRIQDPKVKETLEAGRLVPGHIHARAKRYAVKLFLSHWWMVARCDAVPGPLPKPYALEHLGHVDFIAPPHWPFDKAWLPR